MIASVIKNNRPNLSDNSVKTYVSILNNLYKKMNPKMDYMPDFFNRNPDRVIEFLHDIKSAKRKTILAALVIYCQGHESAVNKYRDIMMKDGVIYKNEVLKQNKTDTQKDNWITQDEVKAIFNRLERETKPIFKPGLTPADMEKVQDFVISAIYSLIPPRRLMDYTEFKLRNINTTEDNYMKGTSFYFNKFKTAKYGLDSFKIPIRLKNIIAKYMTLHDNDYLLFTRGKKLSTPQLNLRLHRIFGNKVSVNALRHSFLSEMYSGMPALEQMNKIADEMGHSVETALEYVKK